MQFQQLIDEGTGSKGILKGIAAFPTTADDGEGGGASVVQPLSHCLPVGKSCRHQQRNIPHTIESAGAIGGAHEQSSSSHFLRHNSDRRVAQIEAGKNTWAYWADSMSV